MQNEVTKTGGAVAERDESQLKIAANKIANVYLSDVNNLNAAVGMPMDEESKRCGVNAILYLCSQYSASAVQALPPAQLVQILQFVTINGLDVFNGQVFLDARKDKSGTLKSITATPMGNAYEIMTKRFGVDVKTVHPARVIHEGDEFEMPQFDGLKMTNVRFKPTLKGLDGKAIAVYYLIEKNDGTLDIAIATRDGVAKNLMAQILNNSLRSENINRNELMKKLEGKSLDDILADPTLANLISPAYRSPASRESMIVTKMKKNALLHYTRDLGSKAYATVAKSVEDDTDLLNKDVVSYQDEDKKEKKANKVFDFSVQQKEEPDDLPSLDEASPKEESPSKAQKKVGTESSSTEPKKGQEEPSKRKIEPKEEAKEEPKPAKESHTLTVEDVFGDIEDL